MTSPSRISGWYSPGKSTSLGESPIFRASDSTLHWIEILCQPPKLHILPLDPVNGDPAGPCRTVELKQAVSVICFRKDKPGSYICAFEDGVAYLDEDTGELEPLKHIEITPNMRGKQKPNDGAIDCMGRFWFGEMDLRVTEYIDGVLPSEFQPVARLWRYSPDGALTLMDSGFTSGNGIAWSPDNKTSKLLTIQSTTRFSNHSTSVLQ
jgi:sugar lactone lactonase YvrE